MGTRPPEPELVFELPLALILGLVVISLVLGYVNGSAGISTVATTIAALVPVLIGVLTWVGTYSVSFRTAVPSTEKVNSLVDAVEEAQSVTIGGGAILYELSQNQSPAKTSQLSTTQATTALAELAAIFVGLLERARAAKREADENQADPRERARKRVATARSAAVRTGIILATFSISYLLGIYLGSVAPVDSYVRPISFPTSDRSLDSLVAIDAGIELEPRLRAAGLSREQVAAIFDLAQSELNQEASLHLPRGEDVAPVGDAAAYWILIKERLMSMGYSQADIARLYSEAGEGQAQALFNILAPQVEPDDSSGADAATGPDAPSDAPVSPSAP